VVEPGPIDIDIFDSDDRLAIQSVPLPSSLALEEEITSPQHAALARLALNAYRALSWTARKVVPVDHPLMKQEAFRAFWLSRLVGQAAQGAVLYALLIVIVDRTDDPFYGSLFVGCSIVPSLLLGLPAGLVVDVLPRRMLLIWLNLLRAGIVLLLVIPRPPLGVIFAVTLAMWTVHQFYNPAEGTTPAALVPRSSFSDAQALSNLALTLAQFSGMVVAGPLLLKFSSPQALFAFCGALFVAAALLTSVLPPFATPQSARQEAIRAAADESGGLSGLLFAGWRSIKSDAAVLKSMIDDVLVGIGLSALVVIAPFYLVRVLGTRSENTVFVFAPAAFGLVLGLRLAPSIGRAIGLQTSVTLALVLFALCVGSLGFVEQLQNEFNRSGIPMSSIAHSFKIPSLVLLVMSISVPAGFASAVVGVSARAVLLERTRESARGQVVATQNVLGNLGALIPTFLAGALANWLGVQVIAVATAAVILAGAAAVQLITRDSTPALAPAK
jgi:hypothetical protein